MKKLIIILTCFVLTFSLFANSSESFSDTYSNTHSTRDAVAAQDSLALVELYNSTDGAGWGNNDNWLTGPVSDWFGITVLNGRVTEINLQGNQLVGTIPVEIGDLTNLTSVILGENQLTGTTPSAIWNLTNLVNLGLYDNFLTGSIPPEVGNLINLDVLELTGNQLSGSIPSEIGNLVNLTWLELENNQLSGSIPPEIGDMTNLMYLLMGNNLLTGNIPSEIGNLSNLIYLWLPSNQLSGSIPIEIGNLYNLTQFKIYENQLTGSIPTEIGSLTNLNLLNLNANQLSGSIPTEIGNLTNLLYLELEYNDLSGSIPSTIGNLINLIHLELLDNQLTGTIPSEIGDLTSLIGLNLDQNELDGGIPVEIGNLVNLDYLVLSNNLLTGAIPTEIGNLTALVNLLLNNNQLSGEIPPEIGNMTNLAWLNLDSNQLTGIIPTEIGNMTILRKIELQNNLLTGSIPSEISSLTNLSYFWLFSNQLSGEIPPEIGDLTSLTWIEFSDNQLSGEIPVEIGNLPDLSRIHLLNNLLTGEIPEEIGNLTGVTNIVLGENQLTGSVPTGIWDFSDLYELDLHGNELTGTIPSEIVNCSQLTLAYIQQNNFTDLTDLSALTNIYRLHIYDNQFTFEDIEPNVGVASNTFNYSPQDSVYAEESINLFPGEDVTLHSNIGGENNAYLWKQDDIPVGSDSVYTINSAESTNSGTYVCEITNTLATELTIYRRPITLNVLSGVASQDSLALVALYNSTDGANWTNNDNWLTGPVTDWLGITVDTGRVTKIELSDNGLTGTLPPEIGDLTSLTEFVTNFNQLTGTIPTEIGYLTNLVDLNFDSNLLSGTIPIEIGNLINLIFLNMDTNQLTGTIPTEIGNLVNLTWLDFFTNQLSGTIPTEIGNLTNLTGLSLSSNLLTGSIPTQIGNLTNLTYLGLQSNELSGSIPSEIGNLTGLENLYIYDNLITGEIPPEIGNLTSLNILNCYGNQLSGVIPGEIGNISGLTSLFLFNNNLTGSIPSEIGNLINLNTLSLSSNQLTGSIPSSIGNLTGLTSLNLANNELSGSIPPEIGNLINLPEISMAGNLLTGPIPAEIVSLVNLSAIYLSENQLSGPIPAEIGNLTNLGILELQNNEITGSIPSTIGNMTNLGEVWLYSNQLTGEIPAEIGNLTNLGQLWLNNNQLSGEIPAEIGNLINLGRLSLSNNLLTADLPIEMENLVDLTELYLNSNQLTGAIPIGIGNLTNLVSLDIGGNQFEELAQLTSLIALEYFSINYNQFTFEDIEPNLNVASVDFTYSPQDSVYIEESIDIYPGEDVTLHSIIGGENNSYLWKQNGAEVGTDSVYSITNADFADSGIYTCEITNSLATELTIYRRPIELNVLSSVALQDSLALVALYNSTDGDNWTNNENWLTGLVSEWFGVVVEQGRVTSIDLNANNLNGTIPNEIGDLTSLGDLNFDVNLLSGAIPLEIGSLTNLTRLSISSNQLTGTIPSEIGNLTNLTEFVLSGNQLTGVLPIEIGNLSSLTRLYLYGNQLSGDLPSELGDLINLHNMELDDNQFTGAIPSEIGNLTNLTSIRLDSNELSGPIPSEIGNMTNLTFINFSNNQLTDALPIEIGNLTNLSSLDLSTNNISGSIPVEIGNMTNLTALWLQGNQLLGPIPAEIGTLVNLSDLYLSENQLSGPIPAEIGNLSNLGILKLQNNEITGSIPTTIGNLTNLTEIWLYSNQLTGSIPSTIGNLTNLGTLGLHQNQLSGPIPVEIGSLVNLEMLLLSSNQLSGQIPSEIGNLVNLSMLDLFFNNFDELPDLSSCVNLQNAQIFENQFTFEDIEPNIGVPAVSFVYSPQDSVYTEESINIYPGEDVTFHSIIGGENNSYLWKQNGIEVGNDSEYSITNADLAESGTYTCEITNSIATELTIYRRPVILTVLAGVAQQDSLALVALYNNTDGDNWINNENWLTGNVSTWNGVTVEEARVTVIELNSNNLNGMIPTEIGDLTNLNGLSLHSNQLSGEIPSDIGNLTALINFWVYGNGLTGSIPTEIGNLINLNSLYLAFNSLSGELPTEIGNLTNLSVLMLEDNQLTGSIPSTIGNLTNLTTLNIITNQLIGNLPVEIGNLSSLEGLWMNGNQLTGSIPSEIGNLSNLEFLALAGNNLSGSIPIEIGNLTNLGRIELDQNNLSGNIPPEIGNLINLTHLSLWANQLSGDLPGEIGDLISLQFLALNVNQLTGELPMEIGDLTNLQYIDLAGNQFTGNIPSEFWSLVNLDNIILSDNLLTGSIPTDIIDCTILENLYLSNNNFIDLPDLTALSNLQILYVYDNQFTFEDIESNIGVASGSFLYSPQDSVYTEEEYVILEGNDIEFESIIGGDNNIYQWYKDGTEVGNSNTLTIENAVIDDSGIYTCEITNTTATELTIYRRPITLDVRPTNFPPVITLPDQFDLPQNEQIVIDFEQYVSDDDGDPLTLTVEGDTEIEVLIDGLVVTLITDDNWLGIETLTFTVDDGMEPSRIINLRSKKNRYRETDTDDVMINVFNPIELDFHTDSQFDNIVVADDPNFTLQFTVETNLPLTYWEWDFDDDGTIDSFDESPTWLYTNPGTFTVSLEAGDGLHVAVVTKVDFVLVLPGVAVPGGEVEEDWHWTVPEGPYNITGEIFLQEGYELLIDPDVQVNVMVDSTLVINGTLTCGAANFTALREEGWYGIILNPTAGNSHISGVNIEDAITAFTINDCSPTIEHSAVNASVDHSTDEPAFVFTGASSTLINDLQITNYINGLSVLNSTDQTSFPIFNNVVLLREEETLIETSTAISILGNIETELDSLFIEGYLDGVVYDSYGTTEATTARMTNSRVRYSENSSRTPGTGIIISDISEIIMLSNDVSGFLTGVQIENIQLTSEVEIDLQNLSILSNEEEGEFGMRISGLVSGEIDSLFIEGFSDGFEYESLETSTGTLRMTNARVRYADNSSRDAGTGLKIEGIYSGVVEDIEIDDFAIGMDFVYADAAGSNVRLTNARVRYSDNSSRNADTGVLITGVDSGVLDSLIVEGFPSGIQYGSSSNGEVRLTNARVRYSDNSSRLFKNYTGSNRNIGNREPEIGIQVSNASTTMLDSLLIEEFLSGLIIQNQDTLSIEVCEIKNCESAIVIDNVNENFLRYNTVYRDGEYYFQTDVPAITISNSSSSYIGDNTIFGYLTGLSVENSPVDFTQNIIWSDNLLAEPIIDQTGLVNASYNDISFTANYPGTGNLNLDPIFVDAASGDFYLGDNSPCVDAGDPNSPLDPDGSIADIGSTYYDQSGANIAPVVIQPISDIYCLEDFEDTIYFNLDEHFFDANGNMLTFSADADEQEVEIDIIDNILSINSVSNWFGTASVYISADDGITRGRTGKTRVYNRAAVIDSFYVFVEGINDPPEVVEEIEDIVIPEDSEEPIAVPLIEHFGDIESDTLYFSVEFDVTRILAEIVETSLSIEIIPGWVGETAVIVSVSDNPFNLIRETCVDTFLIQVQDNIPELSKLYQNNPNPFNAETTFRYDIKEAGIVKLDIYNVKGQLIKNLVSAHYEPGSYDVSWIGKDNNGRKLSSGIYFYRINANGYNHIKKAVLLK